MCLINRERERERERERGNRQESVKGERKQFKKALSYFT